jgi:HAMP domain-containing protein
MNGPVLEVLHVPDCPNLPPLLERLGSITDATVTTREVSSDSEAVALGMAGSPTLLINGRDPFAPPGGCECGLSCRLYRDEHGRVVPAPSISQLREAIAAAGAAPAEVLSAWRTCARPLDPVQRAAHQAILRAFARTGRPPQPAALDQVTVGTGHTTAEVLESLHALDAIRLTRDSEIAVAYPFSAMPTRHRVRIDGRTDAYAMCAVDALGISAMLGADARIESVDVTSGQPVTVTMAADGAAVWQPTTAVVFIGAGAGGGPSADVCCDYLNFFADRAAAVAWTSTHPQIPGQILSQAEAEHLGTTLFGTLLDVSSSPQGDRST